MTQEEKQLLLKDLCARLPYRVRINRERIVGSHVSIDFNLSLGTFDKLKVGIEDDELLIRPYLRPMSSMTEEEWLKLKEWIFISSDTESKIYFDGLKNISAENTVKAIDYLISHHFDYRIVSSTGKSMIESGLALEASEDMYKTE